MDQATQQNAALVEQSAAAAESLRRQAHDLLTAVSVFRTGGASGHALPTQAPAPARAKPVRPMPAARPEVNPQPVPAAPAPVPTAAPVHSGSDDWETF